MVHGDAKWCMAPLALARRGVVMGPYTLWAVLTGSLAASHAAMPPAISLTLANPRLCSRLAAMDER